MLPVRTIAILFLFLVLATTRPGSAQERLVHFGARAAAMGGAFTAVADDATAFYWNPAGYVFGPAAQAGFQWGDAGMERGAPLSESGGEGSLASEDFSGFSLGLTFMGVAGTRSSSTTSRREDQQLASRGLRTFDVALSLLQSLPLDDLVIAANLHYLRGKTHELLEPLEALSPSDRSRSAIADRVHATEGVTSSTGSLDLAALYEPNERFRLGIMVRRLTEPAFVTASGEEIVLPRHARAGVAFRLPRQALVSVDFDLTRQGARDDTWREISIGAEKRFFDEALSLRAGLRAENGSPRGGRPAFSVGAGGRIRFVVAEIAYVGAADDRDEALWFAVTVSP